MKFGNDDILDNELGFQKIEVFNLADCDSPVEIGTYDLSRVDRRDQRTCLSLSWLNQWDQNSAVSIAVTYITSGGDTLSQDESFCPPDGNCCVGNLTPKCSNYLLELEMIYFMFQSDDKNEK